MKALVTNDDGLFSDGIRTLRTVAQTIFEDVITIAPTSEQSGVSHSITLHRPLRITDFGQQCFGIDGTPVDCVFLGLGHVMKDKGPTMVLSGINHGPNVGHDVYYSGTVGAAREAVIHGHHAVAISFSTRPPFDFEALVPALTNILKTLVAALPATPTLFNLNFPSLAAKDAEGWLGVPGLKGLKMTTLGKRFYAKEVIVAQDPRHKPYYWVGGAWPQMEEVAGSDCTALEAGYASLSIIPLEFPKHPLHDSLAAQLERIPNQKDPL